MSEKEIIRVTSELKIEIFGDFFRKTTYNKK